MNSKCYCTGWSLVAGLAASVLALPSLAAALTWRGFFVYGLMSTDSGSR